MKNTYSKFEDQYRGSRELINSRLQVYLPYVAKLLNQSSGPLNALDLGCGRGEWVELLDSVGVKAHGVDLDDSMLLEAKNLNLSVEKKDAIVALKEIPDESISIVSAFQLIEHLTFDVLNELITESFRVLCSDGILILETPNYENLDVSTKTFHYDPSHIAPIPYELLQYLLGNYGFANSIKLLLNEDQVINNQSYVSLSSVIFGAARDYAVIAQKSPQLGAYFEPTNNDFKSVIDLSNAFDNQIHKANELLHSLNGVAQVLKSETEDLKNETKDLKNEINILKSEIESRNNINKIIFRLRGIAFRAIVNLVKLLGLYRLLKPIYMRIKFGPSKIDKKLAFNDLNDREKEIYLLFKATANQSGLTIKEDK